MPLTALVLSVPARIGGLFGVKVFIATVSSLNVLMIMYLSFLLSPTRRTVVISGLISAFYPHFVYYSGLVVSEGLFLFFLTLFFVTLFTISNRPDKTTDSIIIGIIAGICHLTRPTILYFVPVFILFHSLAYQKQKFLRGILFLISFCVVISPWVMRNYSHFGEIVITTSSSGQVLWEGNNPWNKSGGVASAEWPYNDNLPSNLNELEEDQWKKQQAIDYIRSNPISFITLATKKFVRFWHFWPNDKQFQTWEYILISVLTFVPVLFFAIIGVFVLKKQWKEIGIIWFFIAYYTVIHMVTIGSIRYRLPVEPLLVALASATVSAILCKIGSKNGS